MLDAAVFNKMFATTAQIQDIQSAILNAGIFSVCARMTTGFERDCWLLRKFAYLNRACELACAPVHIRPVETSNGIDYVWYTYSPRAHRILPHKHDKSPEILYDYSTVSEIVLGYEHEMTEDQARRRAMGW